MTYLTGAFRSIEYGPDNFSESQHIDRAPVAATALAWRDICELATAGNQLARRVYGLGTAINARKLAAAEGVDPPAWAQDILLPIEDEYQTENLDDLARYIESKLN